MLFEQSPDFRECQFDGIEARAVRRQEQHGGTSGFNRLISGDRLAGRKFVKDDYVAWPERWREDLLDIAKEGCAGHRAV